MKASEFQERRTKLATHTQELDAVIILASAPMVDRNHDVEYPYRQDSDLYYFTGWEQPNAILVIRPASDGREVRFYVQPRNPKWEVWTGPRAGLDEARANMPDASVDPIHEFWDDLDVLLSGRSRLVLSNGGDAAFQQRLDAALKDLRRRPELIQDARALTKDLRLYKSADEIKDLQKAIDITGASLEDAMAKIPHLDWEYEVAAEIEYGFLFRGAPRLGFPSIVGSGVNGTYLHYSDNNVKLDRSGLVLMDVGAEWGYYSADISRTVPVDGSFSKAQRELYDVVLSAQAKGIEAVKPGISWREPHDAAVRELTRGLLVLGLLDGELDTLVEQNVVRKFFMHGTSHWLGLDVHDAGGYTDAADKPHTLTAGMVLTVEPGIYIAPDQEEVPTRYWNIGIRIEDDVLVTPDGHRILSKSIPRKTTEIEALMKGSKRLIRRGL